MYLNLFDWRPIEGDFHGTRATILLARSGGGIELEETGCGPVGVPLDTTTIISR